jgi:broad specificity phosphatase PhoE
MALYLVRHGETEWSRAGRHTSTTDLPLLPDGEEAARALAPRLAACTFAHVLTSPRLRARRTAELAGFPDAVVDEDLVEWAYGDYEGATTAQIREGDPDWTIWDGVTPGGETSEQVTERLDRVIDRVRSRDGDTLVFGHGHCLRALSARWVGEPVRHGRHLLLSTATLSQLGDDRGAPVVVHWNS